MEYYRTADTNVVGNYWSLLILPLFSINERIMHKPLFDYSKILNSKIFLCLVCMFLMNLKPKIIH